MWEAQRFKWDNENLFEKAMWFYIHFPIGMAVLDLIDEFRSIERLQTDRFVLSVFFSLQKSIDKLERRISDAVELLTMTSWKINNRLSSFDQSYSIRFDFSKVEPFRWQLPFGEFTYFFFIFVGTTHSICLVSSLIFSFPSFFFSLLSTLEKREKKRDDKAIIIRLFSFSFSWQTGQTQVLC